jgi:hypothetical protein
MQQVTPGRRRLMQVSGDRYPQDWEGVELAIATTNAIEHMSLPFDPGGRRWRTGGVARNLRLGDRLARP